MRQQKGEAPVFHLRSGLWPAGALLAAFALVVGGGGRVGAQTLYCENPGNGVVDELTLPGGSPSTFYNSLPPSPTAAAIANGNLYVTLTYGWIAELPLSGGQGSFFVTGPTNPTSPTPSGVAISGDDLYLSYIATDSIEEYSLTTGSLSEFASSSSGLDGPAALAICGNILYVSNAGNNTIVDYSLTTGSSSVTGFASTGLDNCNSMAISNGVLYAANFSNSSIVDYTLAGGNSSESLFADEFDGVERPVGLAAYDGLLYVSGGDAITDYSIAEGGTSGQVLASPAEDLGDPVGLVIVPVPEPSGLIPGLVGLGIIGVAAWRRVKFRSMLKSPVE